MTTHIRRSRRGITLTEILISILIMGIGLVSLATLFPVGLLRLREAQRSTRSALLAETAEGDIATQNLFARAQFAFSGFYPQAGTAPATYSPANGYYFYDPFIQDWPLPDPTNIDMTTGFIVPAAVYRGIGLDGASAGHAAVSGSQRTQAPIPGSGLPVAFDPLWWGALNLKSTVSPPNYTAPGTPSASNILLFRFGSGIGFLRNDPNGVNNSTPSAWGLQRLSSLPFFDVSAANATANTTNGPFYASLSRSGEVFSSHDDPVLQTDKNANEDAGANDIGNLFGPGFGSPVLPYIQGGANHTGSLVYDWTYTWMFTGQRSNVSDYVVYDGSIVVFHNRPFGIDQTPASNTAYAATINVPSGERVVEAVFGYGKPVAGYAPNKRLVLLRWPATEPDPEVRVGGWIADVTYELDATEEFNRYRSVGDYAAQRCNWYRVAKKTDPGPDPDAINDATLSNFRAMVLTIDAPVKAQTKLTPLGLPVHVNAALVSPYVVNVFPKVFYSR
jgi:hypothetical protein